MIEHNRSWAVWTVILGVMSAVAVAMGIFTWTFGGVRPLPPLEKPARVAAEAVNGYIAQLQADCDAAAASGAATVEGEGFLCGAVTDADFGSSAVLPPDKAPYEWVFTSRVTSYPLGLERGTPAPFEVTFTATVTARSPVGARLTTTQVTELVVNATVGADNNVSLDVPRSG